MRKASQQDMKGEWNLFGEAWNIYKMFRFAKTMQDFERFVETLANHYQKYRGSPLQKMQTDIMWALQDAIEEKSEIDEQISFHTASVSEVKTEQIVFADVLGFMRTYYFCESDADIVEMTRAADELWKKHNPDVLCIGLIKAVVNELDRRWTNESTL